MPRDHDDAVLDRVHGTNGGGDVVVVDGHLPDREPGTDGDGAQRVAGTAKRGGDEPAHVHGRQGAIEVVRPAEPRRAQRGVRGAVPDLLGVTDDDDGRPTGCRRGSVRGPGCGRRQRGERRGCEPRPPSNLAVLCRHARSPVRALAADGAS